MSKAWAGGSTRAWRTVRAYVLANNKATNGGRCRLALPGLCEGQADQVHHTEGKRAGDNPRQLVAACGPCNKHVGDPTAHDPRCKVCRAPKVRPQIARMTRW